ncbi:hypothetical protein L7F22_006385 [Adiantum nelumboides]|nr:hypothetical protein [Adiantum nelumboides]
MSQTARSSTAFFFSSPLPCKRNFCLSSSLTVRASFERKKGFGPQEKGPSKQQQGSLQGASDEGKKSVVLNGDSRELQSVIQSVEQVRIDGNKEEDSSSEDRQPIPTAHEIGESSGQEEKALQDTSKKRSQHLNIDKAAAAKGKVDFVKVESWGDEGKDQRDLDNLKVKSFSPSFSSRDTTGSFYERLVHRIQLLESKGEISVVHAKSLPRFEDWTFRDATYLQYLVDQHAVFDALRTSIANISEQESKSTLFNENKFAAAVKIFDETLGLERSQALQDDITAFSNTIGVVYKKIVEVPKPTTQTTAYVKYLRQLAGVSGASKPEKEGYLRLLAHIFAVYVAHLTTGMRIGTKALDCLTMLKHSKAVRFYRFYPQNIRDPLKVLIQAINRVAYLVAADDDQETIMEELPKALQKTSLLLAILAVQEKK